MEKGASSPSHLPPSLLSYTNSKTSHKILPFLQLIIQLLSDMIVGIGFCKPFRKMTVVVQLGFLLLKRLYHSLFLLLENLGLCGRYSWLLYLYTTPSITFCKSPVVKAILFTFMRRICT